MLAKQNKTNTKTAEKCNENIAINSGLLKNYTSQGKSLKLQA
jgi:hypothetical protein